MSISDKLMLIGLAGGALWMVWGLPVLALLPWERSFEVFAVGCGVFFIFAVMGVLIR